MIEVWAPKARRMRVRRLGEEGATVEERDLDSSADGWWRNDLTLAEGDLYGFLIDDSDQLRPDPRSRRQPDGVHGPSAVFDPDAFSWTDQAWTGRQLAGGLIYELHTGTFTPGGTLDSAVERLDHLVDIGVTHVELLPVNAFNGQWNWGYDGVLWYAVHEGYGGPRAYQRFVDAAHARGLAVIQDVVYNHLGPSGNYLPEFGPYLREGSDTGWGESVNLAEPAVREFILQNAAMWLQDLHVDGLRLDAVHALHDEGPVHILRELAERTDALSAQSNRPLTLIAESDMNDPTLILPREAGGYGLTAQWSDDWHHAVHVALTGETVGYYADFAAPDAVAKVSESGFFHDGTFSSFRGRTHGKPIPAEVPAWRLVTFAQDHDQIGNRAAGDRLSATLSMDRLAVAAVLTLTAPGTPMLFMGEEWGASTPWQFFTSHPEPELGRAVSEGRMGEFARMDWDTDAVPDPQDPATFERSHLDWSELDEADHVRLLALYRDLAALRRAHPELTDPDSTRTSVTVRESDGAPDSRVYRIDRGALSVLVNLSSEPVECTVTADAAVVLSTKPVDVASGRLVLPAESAAILR
ncbi:MULTISPECIES: malto-oligosyltrehalose trehalohydrolase [unclassified Microbacterium]|uniref:malto-oligosyltrehalose trehalohydrolase n=1 Tax=unclassified Microbacterium TaxID=2609290 RepID=UPI000EAA4619|nr:MULTISPECIES: malto-oligosyltrehalose trehalohydrolase [unclassified Microbacterium]MBT2484032.1 malto-oligosyltrehalose trehalohydrolase [Microbacterium sp. ISL-108]RKN66989.1 malto-oligosyltrehalose trehalohydrolase [Microbacterium sp. CGR2]